MALGLLQHGGNRTHRRFTIRQVAEHDDKGPFFLSLPQIGKGPPEVRLRHVGLGVEEDLQDRSELAARLRRTQKGLYPIREEKYADAISILDRYAGQSKGCVDCMIELCHALHPAAHQPPCDQDLVIPLDLQLSANELPMLGRGLPIDPFMVVAVHVVAKGLEVRPRPAESKGLQARLAETDLPRNQRMSSKALQVRKNTHLLSGPQDLLDHEQAQGTEGTKEDGTEVVSPTGKGPQLVCRYFRAACLHPNGNDASGSLESGRRIVPDPPFEPIGTWIVQVDLHAEPPSHRKGRYGAAGQTWFRQTDSQREVETQGQKDEPDTAGPEIGQRRQKERGKGQRNGPRDEQQEASGGHHGYRGTSMLASTPSSTRSVEASSRSALGRRRIRCRRTGRKSLFTSSGRT